MAKRSFQFNFWRRFHKSQRHVEGLSNQAEEQISEHLVKRFGRLAGVQRFVATWTGLLLLLITGLVIQNILLSGYYQTVRPVPGGIYTEGVLGRFTNANPIFATNDADSSVSRLMFAGLLMQDEDGHLAPDLASDIKVDEHGTTYTVHLKPHLTWQDGQPLTSKDVVFTYQAIQNPDTRSPFQSAWQGVTITAPDPQTVVFNLPGGLAAFPYNLTSGIVPEHLLGKIPPSDLRSAEFNTVHPVGAGPFAWQAIEVSDSSDPKHAKQQIALTPFANYASGKPKLQKFIVKVFASEKDLVKAFADNEVTGVAGLNQIPPAVLQDKNVIRHDIPLRAENMVFFKVSSGVLSDTQVRQALVRATNTPQIIKQLNFQTREIKEPFLTGQLGYDPSLAQASFNPKEAKNILDADGWAVGKDGIRMKDGKPLTFTLVAANTPENKLVTSQLQKQWKAVGVKLNVQLQDSNDFQNSITYHNYDAILNGITVGADSDVFVYWDSSQADVRSSHLNLSEYKNPVADAALEAGRTRLDPTLRVIKYKPFLQEWQKDAPAVGLYQPRLLYLTNGPVAGLTEKAISSPADRFINVQNWQIREAKVTN